MHKLAIGDRVLVLPALVSRASDRFARKRRVADGAEGERRVVSIGEGVATGLVCVGAVMPEIVDGGELVHFVSVERVRIMRGTSPRKVTT